MLIDLHSHSSGISRCCRIPAPEVLKQAKKIGLDGVVLTNHYQKSYLGDWDVQSFVEDYVNEFRYAQRLGSQMDCRVFLGIEVTMELYPNVHILIYGVGEEFLREHPKLFDYSLEQLYKTVNEHNGTLIQAHPFRNGTHVLDTSFLDGVEVNCHPLYNESHCQELLEIAKSAGLIMTCGGDFHADTYRPRCGMYLPDSISDGVGLGEYLRKADSVKLLVHEPNTECAREIDFTRGRARFAGERQTYSAVCGNNLDRRQDHRTVTK